MEERSNVYEAMIIFDSNRYARERAGMPAEVEKMIQAGGGEAIAKALEMDFIEVPEPGLEFELARNFQLLPRYERCSFEDQWCGKVGEHNFKALHVIAGRTDADRM